MATENNLYGNQRIFGDLVVDGITKLPSVVIGMVSFDNELKILNSRIKEIVTFKLPIENSIRNLIKVEKYSSCPIKYPRNYEKIKKKPLK